MESREPKLLDRVRQAIHVRHYSRRTEEAYVHWIKGFIAFHGKVHPASLRVEDVSAFLSWLAEQRRVSASTQNQALSAVLFLYRDVLRIQLGALPPVVRARTPDRLPVVLSREEVTSLLRHLFGPLHLIATLLYGAGLRLEECLELRVKDIDFERDQIVVRQGKGRKDRVTMLPELAKEPLRLHLMEVRRIHDTDRTKGLGRVALPFAAATAWTWQFVFQPVASAAIRDSVRRRAIACMSQSCRRRWPRRRGVPA